MLILFYIGFFLLVCSSSSFSLDAKDTCSAKEPCKQGCCNSYGNCGFGPDFCGKKTCVSSCDAKPECGSMYYDNTLVKKSTELSYLPLIRLFAAVY